VRLARYKWLAIAAVVALAGIFWIALEHGLEVLRFLALQTCGCLVAATIGFAAYGGRVRSRWPGAIALICAAPLLQLVITGRTVWEIVRRGDVSEWLVLLGSLGLVAAALFTLFVKPPPPEPDQVARATAR